MSAPKCVTSLPVASNLSTGSRVEPTQLFVPQRSATQMLCPSLSIVDGARRAPRAPLGHLRPVLDRLIGIGQAVQRRHRRLSRRGRVGGNRRDGRAHYARVPTHELSPIRSGGGRESYGWLFNSVISFSCSMFSLSGCFPAGK